MATVYECDRCHKQQKDSLVTLEFGESYEHRFDHLQSWDCPFRQELCYDCQRSLGQWQRAGVPKKA